MTEAPQISDTQNIVVDEVFPHAPEAIWKALTTSDLIGRWLGMTPTGFAAVKGTRFTYQTTPAGAWDGVIQCEILEVIPHQRLAYAWKGGDAENVGYGAPLDTIATFTLTQVENGTRLRVVHSGFELPRNDNAFRVMGSGWRSCMPRIDAVATEQKPPKKPQ